MSDVKHVELTDLVGERLLSGVDEDSTQIESYGGGFENANCIRFTLDGKTYIATEDPEDGYRSSLGSLIESDTPTNNTFSTVAVTCAYVENRERVIECRILEVRCRHNGKLVLEVGTDNTDDYYPSFVASFNPDAMV